MPWFDISFQHASGPLLRRMRRFGDTDSFLDLVERVRLIDPGAGIRSNVIVGFPGETERDVAELEKFLVAARLDVVGVFGYSDEEGTEAEGLGDKVPVEVVRERVERLTALVEELTAQRAEERIGSVVEVLVERIEEETREAVGRSAHQGPDVDGETVLEVAEGRPTPAVGQIVRARVTGTAGVDLIAVLD